MATTTELAKVTGGKSVLAALADKLECDATKLAPMLKRTAFSTCKSDDEFMVMCMVANTYGLNPLLKEIYAFPSKGGAVVPIVGVDGWTKIMSRNPQFDGIEFDEPEDGSRCTAIIYRKDRTRPIKVTEWLDECKGTTEPWKRWPRRMLRHKAMIQCARLAFGFAGIYDEDEAQRFEFAKPAEVVTEAAPKRGRRATAAEIIEADAEDVPDAALSPALPAAEAPAVEVPPAAAKAAQPQPQAARGGDFLL